MIDKLVIVGVGLIGGSLALALKGAGVVRQVVGVGRDPGNLERAIARGAIDRIESDVAQAVRGADMVFVATPVGAMAAVFERMAANLEPHALVTDGGSTKQSVIEAARAKLGAKLPQYVPSHPIAGSEKSGVEAASSELYRGREVIVTPLAENAPQSVARVRAMWEACGARITEMPPRQHDAVLAAVSHLPHLLAYAYVNAIAGQPDGQAVLAHAGSGFRDFTRLASSHAQMWRDICVANKDALLTELTRYEQVAAELRDLLERGDAVSLEQRFAAARTARDAWLARSGFAAPEGE